MVPFATVPAVCRSPACIGLQSLHAGRRALPLPAEPAEGRRHGRSALCESSLPNVAPRSTPPFVVADVGANPWQYGNQGILLNSDGLKQALFGPLDGPPRNTAQIGQPG